MDGKIKTILRLPSPKFIQVLHANNCFFFFLNFYIFYYYIYFLYFILLISGHWLIVFMESTPFVLVFSWSNLKKKRFFLMKYFHYSPINLVCKSKLPIVIAWGSCGHSSNKMRWGHMQLWMDQSWHFIFFDCVDWHNPVKCDQCMWSDKDDVFAYYLACCTTMINMTNWHT